MEGGTWMFEVQEFIASCQAALKEHSPELAVKELMERIMSRPSEVEAALGTPSQGGITTLLRSDELTVLNIIWPPGMALYPHNHNLWAVIGLYGGQEDNAFFRRNTRGMGLIRAGFKELQAQDAIVLGKETIHAVTNPRSVFTGAIHVYGGDFFAQPRSEWDSEQSEERPYSVERAMQAFAEANESWLMQQGTSI
jgi:predicted metal-dependent enzyme (double-stranded beta helix superfamily)